MGFLDNAKEKAAEAVTKATEVAGGVAGKATEAASRATDAIDEKTGGKLTETVDKVKEKLPTDKLPGRGEPEAPTADNGDTPGPGAN